MVVVTVTPVAAWFCWHNLVISFSSCCFRSLLLFVSGVVFILSSLGHWLSASASRCWWLVFFLFFCRHLFFSPLHVCSSNWLRGVIVLQSFVFCSSQLSFPFCDCLFPLPCSINVVSIGILLQCLLSCRHSVVCCPSCSYRNSAFHTASKTCLNHLQSALSPAFQYAASYWWLLRSSILIFISAHSISS